MRDIVDRISSGTYWTEQSGRRKLSAYERNEKTDGSRPEADQRYAEDEYLLDEIARLKAETEEIRQILKERQIRLEKIESGNNTAILKISDTLNQLSEQIEEAEIAITEAVVRNQSVIKEEVIAANKPLEEKYRKLGEELQGKLETVKLEVAASSDKIEETKTAVQELGEAMQEKAEKKSVAAIHQRLTTMGAIGIVNLVGTIMTLALLCYLIVSLAR